MPFDRGRVTFCRFSVEGDAPTSVDDTVLETLRAYAFQESPAASVGEAEAGFVTGEHLFDTAFTYEKNGFGNLLLFGLRLDTHQPPADVKQAYRRQEEASVAAQSPTGFASKAEKREAKELAERRLQEEVSAGKYRRSKLAPLLWDLQRRTLYCGAVGEKVAEQLGRLMHEAFNVELERLSAGMLARKLGVNDRDHADARPSKFTRAPHTDNGEAPTVPWAQRSFSLKDFLGNEFLIWLWRRTETTRANAEPEAPTDPSDDAAVTFTKTLDMDCAWDVTGKQTLRTPAGDNPTRYPEAADALKLGKWPRKVGLILADAEHQFELTWQADQALVSACALPSIEEAESAREVIEQRLALIRRVCELLDAMYGRFLKERFDGVWTERRGEIGGWIQKRGAARG